MTATSIRPTAARIWRAIRRRAPAGGAERHGRPAADGPETPAGHRDDRHVRERQRHLDAGRPLERQDHAARGDEEADAEPAGEYGQARGAGIDRFPVRRDGLGDGPPAEPADPPQPAEEPYTRYQRSSSAIATAP